MTSAKRATEIIIAEEKSVQYFLENPDKLPKEFQQEIAKARNDTYDVMNKCWSKFGVSIFSKCIYQY